MGFALVMLLVMEVKHYLADFPLQIEYMQGKFARVGWKVPLMCHAAVHALMTFVVVAVSVYVMGMPQLLVMSLMLAMFDGGTHFVIDRVKAHPDIGGKFTYTEKQFWNNIGLDQMAHHLVQLAIVAMLAYAVVG